MYRLPTKRSEKTVVKITSTVSNTAKRVKTVGFEGVRSLQTCMYVCTYVCK